MPAASGELRREPHLANAHDADFTLLTPAMSEPSGKKPAENPEGQVATGKDAIRAALQGVQIDDDDASGADAKHLFWDTQPVPGLSEDFPEDGRMGPIDHTDLAAVRKEPYTLPASFQWTDGDWCR